MLGLQIAPLFFATIDHSIAFVFSRSTVFMAKLIDLFF